MLIRAPELQTTPAQKDVGISLRPLLLPYQQRWVADASEAKVYVKSRRIGATWATAAEAVLCAARRPGSGSDVWYLSQSERDAKEFIRDCARFARAFQLGCQECHDAPVLEDEDGSILATSIRFASGHRITILPGKNPDAIRGKGGWVIFDEAALLDIEACREAADAMQLDMKGGRVSFMSTQRGENNQFNKLVEAIARGDRSAAGYKLHSTTLQQACNDGFYRRLCLIRGDVWTPERERTFVARMMAKPGSAQEFDCIPARDGEVFLARELLEQAMPTRMAPITWVLPAGWETKGTEEWRSRECEGWIRRELQPHLERLVKWERHTLGWDFGRSARGDLSAVAVLAMGTSGAKRRVPWVVELTGVPFNQQLQILEAIVGHIPHFDGAMLDAQGNGSWLAEQATQRWGPNLIESLNLGVNARAWYEAVMPIYKADLQVGDLQLPHYPDLIADHGEFTLVDSVPLLPKRRTKSADGLRQRHGDGALACVMAHARSRGARPVDFSVARTVPSGRKVSSW